MKRTLALLFLPALLSAQTNGSPAQKLFSDFLQDFLLLYPEAGTALGRNEYNDRWADWSAAGLRRRSDLAETYLGRLKQIPLNLSEADGISAMILRDGLEKELEAYRLKLPGMMRVSQMFGAHTFVYSAIDAMPSRTIRDFENIITRLNAVPGYVDQNIALFESAAAGGLVQPRVVVDLMIQQLAAQVEQQQPGNTPLLAAFRRFPASIPRDQQDRLKQQADVAFQRSFLPAWRKLYQYMNETYVPKARATTGINALSGGDRIYAFLVRGSTTTPMNPQEIHQLGLSEVKRIESEMQSIAMQTGFSGSVAEFEKKLDSDPAQHFSSKHDMLLYCRNIAMLMQPELPRLFRLLPRTPS
jgi:uncharacterized protein (DUF885 family)